MRCVYCQNFEISAQHKGRTLTPAELADCYKRLEEQEVHNINLVTADHYAYAVAESLDIYKPSVPIVYNCSGYTSPKTLALLDGLVDIYLPDFKYSNDELAIKYSSAPNYVHTVTSAIKEMIFQVGLPEFDSDGMMKKGVIVRHLVLPSHTKNSIEVIEKLKKFYDDQIMVSLMCQYVPVANADKFPKINRKITHREYEKVKAELFRSGLNGFTQDLSSADTSYIPLWDF